MSSSTGVYGLRLAIFIHEVDHFPFKTNIILHKPNGDGQLQKQLTRINNVCWGIGAVEPLCSVCPRWTTRYLKSERDPSWSATISAGQVRRRAWAFAPIAGRVWHQPSRWRGVWKSYLCEVLFHRRGLHFGFKKCSRLAYIPTTVT